MISHDFPAYATIERAAIEMETLLADLLFVGGATIGFYLTEIATRQHRATEDIDVVVEAASRVQMEPFHLHMRTLGFVEDMLSGVICRWIKADLIVDLMATEEAVFGFKNRWHASAFLNPLIVKLKSGRSIRIPRPEYAVACKVEAFEDRGKGDFQASEDFEDIVSIIDCRPMLVEEIAAADVEVSAYVSRSLKPWLGTRSLFDGISAHLGYDAASQARRSLVIDRMEQIVNLGR